LPTIVIRDMCKITKYWASHTTLYWKSPSYDAFSGAEASENAERRDFQ